VRLEGSPMLYPWLWGLESSVYSGGAGSWDSCVLHQKITLLSKSPFSQIIIQCVWSITMQEPYTLWGGRQVHFPQAGSFRCSETELGFEVRAAVTVKYEYESWRCYQTELEMQQWMVAGPLFNICAEPAGAVAAVHLPHFVCLAGGEADGSQMRIAHFVDGRMTLEEPMQVMPFHAVLENPRFSLFGVIWNHFMPKRAPPVHSVTLLYRALRAENITFHLYLIPDIFALKKGFFKIIWVL
uniref:FIIND domain-containing protein n=1 Tax=Gopherus evgoodei TaxID=1825980 RepID=A0A8C4VS66_9SAUR